MYTIRKIETIAPQTKRFEIHAPGIAAVAKAGQFVIVRPDEEGERIPLTLVDWDPKAGTITLIFQEVGVSTKKLGSMVVHQKLHDLAGPLGNPSEMKNYGTAVVIGGGVGTAVCLPVARALKNVGNRVISIIGARSENLLILENEMESICDEVYISTDDGSKGHKGFVSDVLKTLIDGTNPVNIVYAMGPAVMMRAVAEVTRPYGIKTIVSLNPIMVDGMGMCGACRVSIDNEVKFACVDGPEFDAHQVDFNELIKRQRAFLAEEKHSLEQWEKGAA